jgi:voltage-gated potassium channel
MKRLRRTIRRLLVSGPLVRLLLFIVALWALGAVALRWTEGRANPDFDSLPKVVWNIAVYLFSGLDSGMPQTAAGKVAVTALLVLSLGIVATFTGTIASYLVERRLGGPRKMPEHELTKHHIVCNWNDKAVPIVRELHASIVKDRRPIVVVSEKDEAGSLPSEEDADEFEDVYLIKGDPADEIMLRRANVHLAHSVVVLADPDEGKLADARSILICMAVASVCKEAGRPKAHICVEGVSPQNVGHLRRAGADEIISASDFAMMLLSQSALEHNLSVVYRDLLTVSEATNEIYVLQVPEDFVGRSFGDLGAAMFRDRDPSNPAILIGVMRGKDIFMNPRTDGDRDLLFERGDRAIVIALERPDRLV